MGSLALPSSGAVYVDTDCVIYAVERISPYEEALRPLWRAAAREQLAVMSSELTLLETTVKPIRNRNAQLETAFRTFLLESREFVLLPIDLSVLERAAQLRAQAGLKTPDAIHAATALEAGVALFVTNDAAFRRVPGLEVDVLSEDLST